MAKIDYKSALVECGFGAVFYVFIPRVHFCLARLLSECAHWLICGCNVVLHSKSLAVEQVLLIRKAYLYGIIFFIGIVA